MRSRHLLLALLMAAPLAGRAQSFAVDWFSVDGGGGASTGGSFTVSGSIGQADADSPLAGGRYAVQGGFWSFLAALQSPGGPRLSIACSNHNATVTWPAPADGWILRACTNLTAGTWTNLPPPYATNNLTNLWYAEPLAPGIRIFQLYQP
jgi:hypothetical protein